MRVRTKLGLGFTLMGCAGLVCGLAGYRGMGTLSDSLAYLTGPAWQAADGAMEAAIGLKGQMLSVDRLTGREEDAEATTLRERLKSEVEFTQHALESCRDSKLFQEQELRGLNERVGAYERVREALQGEHARFVAADDAYARALARMQEVMTQAEEVGDQQVEQLERDASKQVSWGAGLETLWAAADGAMEAQIALLESAYHYRRACDGEGAEPKAAMERALARFSGSVARFVKLPAFSQARAPGGVESISKFLERDVPEYARLALTALARRADLRASETSYRRASNELLKTLEAVEAAGDVKVEGEKRSIEAARQGALQLIAGAVLGSLLIAFAITWLLARDVVGRLERLDDVSRKVAGGDLAQRVESGEQDEVGLLAGSFQSLIDTLREYVGRSAEVTRSAGAASAQVNASVQAQSRALTDQASAVAEATSALEELKANALENDDRAREVLGTTKSTVRGMSGVQDQMGEIATSIVALSEKVKQIDEILDTVSDIADQSNLLALNASIEASKAGEYGRGFEVVASEVRNLAQQSQKATLSIRTMLRGIQSAMSSAVMRTEEGTKRVVSQATDLETATQSVEQIVYATREQTRAIEQIADAVSSVSGGVGQSQASSSQIAQAMGGLVEQLGALEATLRRFAL
ncbi:MAG: methyl-accepting chemotaxis protein [Planctomycetota bacterium]